MANIPTWQKRFRLAYSPIELAAYGARKIGVAEQHLIFLNVEGTEACLRDERDGVFHYTRTGDRSPYALGAPRFEHVEYQALDFSEGRELRRLHGTAFELHRTRTIYTLKGVQINVDAVSYLGDFIEIRAEQPEVLAPVIELLGLTEEPVVDESYYELMLAKKLTAAQLAFIKLYNRYEGMTYGIVSGILTAIAVVLGAFSEESTAEKVIMLLVAIAVGDAWSDALGQFRSEWTKWDSNIWRAANLALCTLAGKMLMPLTFVGIFLSFSLATAIWVSCFWMALVLGGHAYVEAIARARSTFFHPLAVLVLSFAGVGLTKLATMLFSTLSGS